LFFIFVFFILYWFMGGGGGGWDREHQTDKHLPPSIFTGQLLRKADI
jgi:hypothetical protein